MDGNPDVRQWVENELLSEKVNWEELVWMASSHFVLTAVYSALVRNKLVQLLPEDLALHLSDIYQLNVNRNRHIVEQAHQLIRIFDSKGIEPVFLKGTGHLLQGLYHDIGDRIMSDIDILVSKSDINAAAQALYENGYFHPDDLKDDDFGKHHHLPGFENGTCVARVELHYAVFPHYYSKIVSTDEILCEKQKIAGLRTWVLSLRHQMILNFVHDQLADDDLMYKTMQIKGLYDFYLLSLRAFPEKIKPSVRGYEQKFNTYCAFISTEFNAPDIIPFESNRAEQAFHRQFNFLLDHPKTYTFYQFMVLYRLRITEITRLIFTAPFSKQSRRYIRKKAGSMKSLQDYFRRLAQGK